VSKCQGKKIKERQSDTATRKIFKTVKPSNRHEKFIEKLRICMQIADFFLIIGEILAYVKKKL